MPITLALGTVLSVETTPGGGTYTPVGKLNTIGTPSPTKGETETTNFDSAAREFLGTLPDNGEIAFTGFMVEGDAGQELLYDDANSVTATERAFRIDFTRQDARFDFDGYVRSFQYTAGGVDDAHGFTGAIRVTGAVTKIAIP